MKENKMKEITVSVVRYDHKILLLQRQGTKKFDPGKWEFVSGFVKRGGTLQEQARHQIILETGLNATILRAGKSFKVTDEYGIWLIHPFLFSSENSLVNLRTEDHSQYAWVNSKNLNSFSTVKDLQKNLEALGL